MAKKKKENQSQYQTTNPIVNLIGSSVGILNSIRDKSMIFVIGIFAFGWYFSPKFIDSINNLTKSLYDISSSLKDIKDISLQTKQSYEKGAEETKKENIEQTNILRQNTLILQKIQEMDRKKKN